MKKLINVLSVLFSVFMLACFISCGCGKSESVEREQLWLDRYEEKVIVLKDGDANDYKWTSSDVNVVTVENGKIIAQNTGTVEVTGKSGNKKVIYTIKVNDSGAEPRIDFDAVIAYVDVVLPICPKITYNGQSLDADLEYKVKVADTSVAESSGLSVKGLKVGETKITVNAEYKGLALSTKKTLVVKPNTYLELLTEDVTLIYADNNKVNQKSLEFEVVKNGEIRNDIDISFRVLGTDCVEFDGNKIIAKAVGETEVRAFLGDDESVYCDFGVKVSDSYVEDTFSNYGEGQGATLETTDEVIDGKGNLTKYTTGTLTVDYRGWTNYWNHRIQNSSWGGNAIEKYREGYRYFVYDMYLTEADRFLLGMGGILTWDIEVDVPFRVDWCKILDEDGNVINRIKTNQWITVCYDLYGMIYNYPDATTSFFLTVNKSNAVTYLANIGYRFDGSFIHRNPEYEEDGDVTHSTNDEFLRYVSDDTVYNYYDGKVDGISGAYVYVGNDDYLNHTLAASASLGMSRVECSEYLYDKGEYLLFDLYLESDVERLYFALDERQTEQRFTVGVSDVSKCDWIHVVKDGSLQYSFEVGKWQTVWVDIAKISKTNLGDSLIAFEFGLMNNSTAYINNIRYAKNNVEMPADYEGHPPFAVKPIDEHGAQVSAGENEFEGYVNYKNASNGKSGGIYFEEVQKNNLPGVFFSEKYRYITFDLYLTENVNKFTFYSNTSRKATDMFHEFSAAVGEKLILPTWLKIMDEDGKAVTEIKTNEWYKVSAYIEYLNGIDYSDVGFYIEGNGMPEAYLTSPSFSAYDEYGSGRQDETLQPDVLGEDKCDVVLTKDEGFEDTYKYVNWTNRDRDGVYFTSVVDKTFFESGYKYITFDFYLTDSVNTFVVYSWTSANGKGIQYQKTLSAGLSFVATDDGKEVQHFYFFDKDGNAVSKIEKGAWYTVCMEVEYATYPEWTHIFFAARNTKGVNSVAYLKNVRTDKDRPLEWNDPSFTGEISADALGFTSNDLIVTTVEKNGMQVKKLEGTGTVWFKDVMNETGYGDFFATEYACISFDVYFESGNGFYLQTKYHAVWHNLAGTCGKTSTSDGNVYFEFFDSNGGSVSSFTAGQWYTIKAYVAKDLMHVSQVCYTFQSSATVYMRNLKFVDADYSPDYDDLKEWNYDLG